MRRALAATSLAMMAMFLTACGDDGGGGGGGSAGGAPTGADKSEFCDAMADVPSGDEPSVSDAHDWADKLIDVGTPDGISDDERNGFEVFVNAVKDADEKDLSGDSQLEDVVKDSDDVADVQAFFSWYGQTCAEFLNQ